MKFSDELIAVHISEVKDDEVRHRGGTAAEEGGKNTRSCGRIGCKRAAV
jgi:hypothetical protein